jgi:hypothetical protein
VAFLMNKIWNLDDFFSVSIVVIHGELLFLLHNKVSSSTLSYLSS